VDVDAGDSFGLGRRANGTIASWSFFAAPPMAPPGLSFTAISGGGAHALARLSDGNLVAWGSNAYGVATVPALPAGLTYEAMSAGSTHNVALRNDGSVVTWGSNFVGELLVPAFQPGYAYARVCAGNGRSGAILLAQPVDPVTYCTAKRNSVGCTPEIGAIGTPSATASSGFEVRASSVNSNAPGILLYGNSGRAATPFTGGLLCLAGPLRRVSGLSSGGTLPPQVDCSGLFAVDLNAFRSGALGGNPATFLSTPGAVIEAQFWGRDHGFLAPNDTALTDAVEFSIRP
jgi:hypothetical protein